MIFPTIHLNGTNVDDLIAETESVRIALMEALHKLRAMTPNGRDYYPQGTGVAGNAIDQHSLRLAKVNEVNDEIATLLEYLYEQRDLRERTRR